MKEVYCDVCDNFMIDCYQYEVFDKARHEYDDETYIKCIYCIDEEIETNKLFQGVANGR